MKQGNTDPLTVLQERQDAILLAEIGALIHDLGKLSAEFIRSHAEDYEGPKWEHELILRLRTEELQRLAPEPFDELEAIWALLQNTLGNLSRLRQDFEELYARAKLPLPDRFGRFLGKIKGLSPQDSERLREKVKAYTAEKEIAPDFIPDDLRRLALWSWPLLDGEEISIACFIEEHGDPIETERKAIRLFKPPGCDGVDSAVDKGDAKDRQSLSQTYIATAFGYEGERVPVGPGEDRLKPLREELAATLVETLGKVQRGEAKPAKVRDEIFEAAEPAFRHALGETRRGANDVTLWDHAYSVASLYKAALARVLVEGWVEPKEVRWQLLYIAFDGLGFLAQAHRVGDLLGRQRILDDAMNAVKTFIEVELPLGNEVYRDENGIAFVLPWFEQEENRQALEEKLKREIEGRFLEATDGELVPKPHFGEWAGDLSKKREKALLELSKLLGKPRLQRPTSEMVRRITEDWEKAPPSERCPICGLRPKREAERACEVCEERRERRARDWCRSPERTIWIDEVVDDNGWVALMVGRFDLTRWLNGEFVQTLLVAPGKPKNPSPARLRRVWETTQRFWQGIAEGEEERWTRQRLILALLPEEMKGLAWGNYDASLPGSAITFGVFWDERRGLIVIEHLDYLSQRLRCPRERLAERLAGGEIVLREPSERLERGQEVARVHPMAYHEALPYAPFIRILTTPRQFLTLLPASRALALAEDILEKYEREMGKVRDRLPLTLEVVYFRRHTPLYAAVDAARRLLSCPTREEPWEVTALEDESLRFANRVTWPREERLGDGSKDCYYSWVKVEGLANRVLFPQVQIDRNMRLWVQAGAFDFEVLDTATRRFAIRYDGNGRRLTRPTRPYLPEQLDEWRQVWELLEQDLTTSQVEALTALVERKREEWGEPLGEKANYSETFRRFVQDTLINVAADRWKRWNGEERALVETYLLSGRLADVLEVHMKVMKQRPRREG